MNTVKNYNTTGDKISESVKKTDIWGNEYVDHYNTCGDKVGFSRKETGFWGDESIVHCDNAGNAIGRSYETSNIWGDKRVEHYDAGGNYAGFTSETEDFFGNKYDIHNDCVGNTVGRSDGTLFDDPKEDNPKGTNDVCSGSSSYSSFDVAGALPDFDVFLSLVAGALVCVGFFKIAGAILGGIGTGLTSIVRLIGNGLTTIIRRTVFALNSNSIIVLFSLTTIVLMFSVAIGIILDEDTKSIRKGIYGGLTTAVCLSVAVNPYLNPFLWVLKDMLGRPSSSIIGYIVFFALFVLLPFIAVALWYCILDEFCVKCVDEITLPVCFGSVIIIMIITFFTLAKFGLLLSFVVTGVYVYIFNKLDF